MPKQAFDLLRDISILYSGASAFMAGILSLILIAKGLSLAEVGYYFVIYSACALVLLIPAGAFSDTYGRKKSMSLGFFIRLATLLGFVLLPKGPVFLAFAIPMAVSDSMVLGSAQAHAVDMLRQRGKAGHTHRLLSSAIAWQFVMFTLGAAIGGYAATSSIDYPVLMCVLFAVSGLLYCLFVLRDSHHHRNFLSAERSMIANMTKAVAYAADNSSIRTLAVLSFLLGLGLQGLFSYWQPVLKGLLGWDIAIVGLFSAVTSISMILGAVLSPRLKADWMATTLLLFLLSASLFIASWSASPLAIIISLSACWLMLGLYLPLVATICNDNTPSAMRATISSVAGMAYNIGGTAFGIFVFMLGAGEPRLFWTIGAAMLLLGFSISLVQSRQK